MKNWNGTYFPEIEHWVDDPQDFGVGKSAETSK